MAGTEPDMLTCSMNAPIGNVHDLHSAPFTSRVPDVIMEDSSPLEMHSNDITVPPIDQGSQTPISPTQPQVPHIQRYKAPCQSLESTKWVRDVPAGVFKAAVTTRAELYARHRQRFHTKKHEASRKKNMVVSVYREDVLVRVLVSESLPFLCALCGESFAHTTPLREHMEQVHGYFQAVAKKAHNKSQVIIERPFESGKNAETGGEHGSQPVDQGKVGDGRLVGNGELEHSLLSDTDLHHSSDEEAMGRRSGGDDTIPAELCVDSSGLNDELGMILNSGTEIDTKAQGGKNYSMLVKRKEKRTKQGKRKEFELVSVTGEVKLNLEGENNAVNVKNKKRKIQNPSPCCVVCGLKNKTRVIYRQHLADAHHIFSTAEEAFECAKRVNSQGNFGMSLMGDNEMSEEHEARTGGRKIIKCDFCETYVFDEALMQKHMRAHCGLPGLKCDICLEGIRLWEEGKMSEVRGLMEKFLRVDRREEDMDYVCENGDGETGDEDALEAGSGALKTKRSMRFTYSNIVSSCYECGEKYYMRYHMGLHHKKAHSSLTCKECRATVPSLQALKIHSMKHHDRGIFSCPYCPRAFHDRGKYNYHHAGHMGIFGCPGCGRSFLEKPSLDNHLKKYANHPTHFEETEATKEEYSLKKPYIFDGYVEKASVFPVQLNCPVCQEAFVNAGNLTKHMNSWHPELLNHEENFVCDICGKMFGNRKNLRSHQRTHIKKFQCTFEGCNRAYHMLHKLKEHLHVHSATKDFHCDQCEKSFRTVASLRFHKRKHNDDAPVYQCALCQRTCRTRTDLRYHVEGVHGDKKNHQCEQCGKRFSTKLRLASHSAIHKEKRFFCSTCPAAFRARQLLEAHQRTHNKPYTCENCLKGFNKEQGYRRHLYTKHSIGEPVPKRAYNSSKSRGQANEQTLCEAAEDYRDKQILNVRVEYPDGNVVAHILGIDPLP